MTYWASWPAAGLALPDSQASAHPQPAVHRELYFSNSEQGCGCCVPLSVSFEKSLAACCCAQRLHPFEAPVRARCPRSQILALLRAVAAHVWRQPPCCPDPVKLVPSKGRRLLQSRVQMLVACRMVGKAAMCCRAP